MREYEAKREKPRELDGLNNFVQRVGKHTLIDATVGFNSRRDVTQPWDRQNDACGLHNIGCTSDCDSNLRLLFGNTLTLSER